MFVPLILGDFVFDETQLEVPEKFGDVGGTQSIAQHKYPGGVITQQSFGFFPEPLKWSGRFSGKFASDDARAVGRILYAGKEVQLTYGDHAWIGRVAKFSPTVRHQWLYEYTIEFWPRVDIANGLAVPPLLAGFGAVLSLHILSLKSLIASAASGNVLMGFVLPFLSATLGSFIPLVQGALLEVGGIIGSISVAKQQAISASALAVLAQTAPLEASTDPTLSSPASDVSARVRAISDIISVSTPPRVATVQVVNPNLAVLATQYYQDPTQWRLIADANGLSDPMPIGSFVLAIPPGG